MGVVGCVKGRGGNVGEVKGKGSVGVVGGEGEVWKGARGCWGGRKVRDVGEVKGPGGEA